MKRSSSSDTETALTLLFEVGRIIRRAMVTKQATAMPLSYIETLRFIEEKGKPTMRDVAAYLRIAAPSATAIVEALVSEGHLERSADGKDRRIVRLALTAKGARLLAKTARIRLETLRGLVGTLSARDRKEFIKILSKIVNK
jgi:DNA-binding MarR family transcriptional regulator